ncbi:MAG: alpha-L-rhamnosidase N-terminal domain-containing protein, partial [Bacteroidales bacterium]|nr:alpha-L-rhamnosidase N-terminal domain-containing protein [Bacteroidales bacterium]
MTLRTKAFIVGLFSLFVGVSASAQTQIVNLRTESMETPIGIDDARPYFSWQMTSDRIGASQRAYRLTVAASQEDLAEGKFVYDSGMSFGDSSINIPYKGVALKGATRYFWKVDVMDEQGNMVSSEPSWFETGLMGLGWSRAQWIGSENIGASKYRTFFNIDYDVQIPVGSTKATFAYSVKDKNNYITVELDVAEKNAAKFIVRYAVEGEVKTLSTIDVSDIVTEANKNQKHSVRLEVSTPGYHLKSNLIASIDGVMLKPTQGVSNAPARENVSSGNPYQMVITPYPGGEYITDWARLHSIGFKQPKGQKAEFSNIKIWESNWNTVLYTDPVETHKVTGNGALQVWEPYGLVSAPMLRRNVELAKPVKSARLYVTARGIYEFYINGQRVSNDYFNPGWTDYRYRIMYNSYDVSSMLKQGSNGIGAMLGSGWYSDLNIFTSVNVDPYGIKQSMMAKLVVTFEDGTSQTVVTDGNWKKYDNGPVVRNGFQFGEDYDARKEVDGWKDGGFDDSAWEKADIFERPAAPVQIQAYVGLPIQNNITLDAISVSEPVKGTFVYDFGKNV